MSVVRLLVVEDDLRMQRLLQSQLAARGFAVDVVGTGEEALLATEEKEHDLILLDISLPGDDGLSVCRQIREWSDVPIILVTAADSPQTKVTALELGADDYLTKPFHTGELVARIRAILRRAPAAEAAQATQIIAGDLEIDVSQRRVTLGGKEIQLTKTEFDLLKELARHPDRVLTYQHILENVWGHGYEDVRPVQVHVCNLRRKLEPSPTATRYILSVSGVGYQFRLNEE